MSPFSSWGFYAFAFKLFFFFFQGEHSSTIEKSYFCKRKKEVRKEWCELPLLAQAIGDVNSQVRPMVHKNFHKAVCLSAPFQVVSCYTFLFVRTTYNGDESKKKAMPLTPLLFYWVTLCHILLIPVSCFVSVDRLFRKTRLFLSFCPSFLTTTNSEIAHIVFHFYFWHFNVMFLYYF